MDQPADTDDGQAEVDRLERLSRGLLIAIYALDLAFLVDLMADQALRRWVARQWAQIAVRRRRRAEFERARAQMLFEAIVVLEEGTAP